MKKLIIAAFTLSLFASPAIAGSITGVTPPVSSGSDGQIGTYGNSALDISVTGATGNIVNNGNYAAFFGSSNTGSIAGTVNINNAKLMAPTFPSKIDTGKGGFSYTTVSGATIGANTYYESKAVRFEALQYEDGLINLLESLVDD